ncbi:hypothetical protein GC169_01990 [bacterium]|nr:hypothetical protein [bacterium]
MKMLLATGLLAALLIGSATAAAFGPVELGAGDLKISLSRMEAGFALDIEERTCPPRCGIQVNWRPLSR